MYKQNNGTIVDMNRGFATAVAIIALGISALASGIGFNYVHDVRQDIDGWKKSAIESVELFLADEAYRNEKRFESLEGKVDESLGAAGTEIPTVVALFETSLASAISSSATSMTLVSATDKAGTTLASSTYAFIIDEGTASEEFVIADCTGTACTNMIRGVSILTGTTSVASLQKSHRRGASVKITDGPQLMIISRILNGVGSMPNPIKYNNIATTTIDDDRNNLATWGLVQDTSFNSAGAVQSSATGIGYVELASGCEAASSTSSGSAGILAIPASLATSTFYSSTLSGCKVIAAKNNGKIDDNFIATSSLISNNGVTYTLPRSRQASSTVLAENGSGTLSWVQQDWTLIVSTTTTAAMQFASTTFSSGYEELRIVIDNPTNISTANGYIMRFNNDAASNYGFRVIENSPSESTYGLSAQSFLALTTNTSTTSAAYFDIDIHNPTSTAKMITWQGAMHSTAAGSPAAVTGSAKWNNTTDQITSFQVSPLSQNLPSGTRIRVYGGSR